MFITDIQMKGTLAILTNTGLSPIQKAIFLESILKILIHDGDDIIIVEMISKNST